MGWTGRAAAAPPTRRATGGNQAALRSARDHAPCTECDKHAMGRSQHADGGGGAGVAAAPLVPVQPTSVDVWGIKITTAMCGCRDRIRDNIAWANEAARTYNACKVPGNTSGSDIEACFDAAHPEAVEVAHTDSAGAMTLPAASTDPCDRIDNKATFVHEIMHSRHAAAMARAQGNAFYQAWKALAGTPDRLETLRATFPTQVAAFEAQWDDATDWADDEVHSYTWERRFYEDALSALARLCRA